MTRLTGPPSPPASISTAPAPPVKVGQSVTVTGIRNLAGFLPTATYRITRLR